MGEARKDAAQTLGLLEERLRRVDYILNGNTTPQSEPVAPSPTTAAVRLRNLERGMKVLASKSGAIADLLALHEAHPAIFPTSSPSDIPTTLPTPALASIIFAHASLYRDTASQLSQLGELSIPDPGIASKLIEESTRIEAARAKQEQQLKEFAELRARSARTVEEWYEGGVLAMGEHWASWEERLKEVEILVRRREAAKKRDEGMV